MKQLLRKVAGVAGQRLLPETSDPVLRDLIDAYSELRLRTNDPAYWQHRLSRVAALGHLRDLLKMHRVGCVLDVGANTGQFAQSLRKIGYEGRIVSFEPMDRARQELEKYSREDDRWQVRPEALGKKHEQRELQLFTNDTFSSLHKMKDAGEAIFGSHVNEAGSQTVTVVRLDDLWSEIFAGHPGCGVLLKTDTQGHDLEVLQGAEQSLQNVATVMSEASVERIYEDSPTLVELASYLEGRGFRASGYYPFSHRPESLAMIELDAFFVRI